MPPLSTCDIATCSPCFIRTYDKMSPRQQETSQDLNTKQFRRHGGSGKDCIDGFCRLLLKDGYIAGSSAAYRNFNQDYAPLR